VSDHRVAGNIQDLAPEHAGREHQLRAAPDAGMSYISIQPAESDY